MNVASDRSSTNPTEIKGKSIEDLKYHLKLAVRKAIRVERIPEKKIDDLFTLIQLIDNILSSNMTLSKQQNLDYCKSQRYLMKLYMKKMMDKTSD